jgi:hypothetical protein
MVAVLTGRLGGPHAGEGDLPGGGALVLADQVRARVDERQVREDPGQVPRVQAGARFCLPSVRQQRAGVGRQLRAQRPGARLASPIAVSAEDGGRAALAGDRLRYIVFTWIWQHVTSKRLAHVM